MSKINLSLRKYSHSCNFLVVVYSGVKHHERIKKQQLAAPRS